MWAWASRFALFGVTATWLCCLSTEAVYADAAGVTLKLPGLGALRGSLNTSAWTSRAIYQFQGIPFAKPPVGHLRFKPPEPADPWNGTLDATKFGKKCPALTRSNQEQEFKEWTSLLTPENTEDCLTLNVYTPKLFSNASLALPVMVYIHGGSFRLGSAQEYWPNYLLEKDVVLVVPQYRLGPLGFLSLQTEDVPGNMGLMDQALALRWVRNYISFFGGDPDRVTIFGQSAGGAAVTLMQLSPLVDENLFAKVIAQSGSALATWVIDRNPVRSGLAIARLANCNQTKMADLTACLREIPVKDLLLAHSKFLVADIAAGGRGTGGNHPVIQTAGNQRFLVEPPLKSIQEGRFKHVPLLGGVTRHEGSFILGRIEDTTGMISDLLNEKYFQSGELGNFTAMTPGLIDICGVALLKAATFRFLLENSRQQRSFLYSFNYFGEHTKFGYGVPVDYPFPGGTSWRCVVTFTPGRFTPGNHWIGSWVHPRIDLDYVKKRKFLTLPGHELQHLYANYAIPAPRCRHDPAPANGVSFWPAMSTETGPYLRIDRTSEVRVNFLEEYAIATTAGLGPSRAPLSAASMPTLLLWPWPLLMFLTRSIRLLRWGISPSQGRYLHAE
ncbi:carboxylesterase 1E isoform X3 [Cryptotermes secundus]|uniref:carboxylesterase 1E isoform X3 n=1 Tax=Cryptotermes secundus TaxID=105785 RepID=UPI001454BD82|nr:carboxylesterase 1E isoform X3 [Cryptotermes secundus]